MKCSFCERPLACRQCQSPYEPASQEEYQAVFQAETSIYCPQCAALLVCNHCGVPCGPVEQEP